MPLKSDEHQACLHLKERNLHGLVDPEGVGLFIPAVRVIVRGVVCVEADGAVLVKRDKIYAKRGG